VNTTVAGPDAAPEFDPIQLQGHLAEAEARLPGPNYYTALQWVHEILRPASYVEIGVGQGGSLAAASPDTLSLGIDPLPELDASALPSRTRLFAMTSDEFFARHELRQVLGRSHFSLAFIDGLHLFEQALRDFIHLERAAGPESVIMIHDCLPLNALTAARARTTAFYTGDVWKLVTCLVERRPDLRLAVVRTPPSGLALVTRPDPTSHVLPGLSAEVIASYANRPFHDHASDLQSVAGIENSYDAIRDWLDRHVLSM
jgi:hypothetical protein